MTSTTMVICEKCNGTGFRRRDPENDVLPCECRTAQIYAGRQAYVEKHFPRFTKATFTSYRPTTAAEQKAVRSMQKNPATGYFIVGEPLKGKTHLLISQFKIAPPPRRCILRSSRQLVEELREAEMNPEFESPVLNALQDGSLHLFWDDCDKLSFDKSAFRRESIFEFIDEMWRTNTPVSATSNLNFKDLQQLANLDPGAARRLIDLCTQVPLV